MLEVSSWEASENYLGVALIRSGDTVIVERVVSQRKSVSDKLGGTAGCTITRPFLYSNV